MTNASELLPCPFCGGPAVNVAGEYVHCGGKIDCIGRQIKADADDWNTRQVTQLEAQLAEMREGLDWQRRTINLLLTSKPVRDVPEMTAFVDRLLTQSKEPKS